MSFIKNVFNSSLFKSTLVYGLSSAVNGALPFFLLPLLTRYLSPDDYGALAVFMTLVSFYNVFIGINLNGVIFNRYFHAKDSPNYNFSNYISNTLIVLFCTSLFFVTLTFVFKSVLIRSTNINFEWILLAAVSPLFQYLILILLSLFQAENKPASYAKLLTLQSFINVSVSLALIISFQMNWAGRSIGIFTALLITGLISLYILSKKFSLSLNTDKKHLADIFNFCLPLVPHTLGGVLISLADRFIITNVAGNQNLGFYQAGVQISMAILFLTDAFNKAYAPWLFNALQKKSVELNRKIVKSTYLYFAAVLALALIISSLPDKVIVSILGDAFLQAKQFIFWSSLAYAFNGMYLMVCNYIFYSNQTKYLSYITLPVGALNILLSYYLTLEIGVVGACMSMAFSYFVMFLLTWWRSTKLVKMPWFSNN